MATLANGYYSIRHAPDWNCLDVINGSNAERAGIALYPRGSNKAWQLFQCTASSDGTYTVNTWVDDWITGATNKYLRGYAKATGAKGGDVRQSATKTAWTIADTGATATINGTSYALYTVECSHGYLCDNGTGGAMIGTDADRWAFVGDIPLQSAYAAPSALCVAAGQTWAGSSKGTRVSGSAAKVWPSWVQGGTDYQLRYRTRWSVTTNGHSSWGAWGNWTALADGSTGNGGWGTKGQTSVVSGGRNHAATAITLDMTKGTWCQLQYEVRMADTDRTTMLSYRRGNAASLTCIIGNVPTVKVSSVAWSPDYMTVNLTTTNTLEWNTVYVNVVGYGTAKASRCGTSPSVLVDTKDMDRMPASNATVTVKGTLDQGDGLWPVEYSGTAALTVAGASGQTKPTRTPIWGGVAERVDAGTSAAAARTGVWISDASGRLHQMRRDSAGHIYVVHPQGIAHKVLTTLGTSSGFALWQEDVAASTGTPSQRLVWEGGYVDIRHGAGSPPSVSWDVKASTDVQQVASGGYDHVTIGAPRSQTFDVTGVLEAMGDQWAVTPKLRALMDAKYCWLAAATGDLWRVAVESVSVTPHRHYTEAKVSLRRIDG